MKKIFTFLLLLNTTISFAQDSTIEWQNTIGGDNADGASIVFQTKDGGYILGGASKSNISGDKTENWSGSNDWWIVKIDRYGNIIWQKTIEGAGAGIYGFTLMIQTKDGGYLLGSTSSAGIIGDKTQANFGIYDYWIVKLDSNGNVLWDKSFGGSDGDWLQSIEQTSDGGFILGGYSYSDISGNKTENRINMTDYWVIKTDINGNIEWQNTIGGNGEDQLRCIHQTSDNGFILGGLSDSDISGDKTENKIVAFDYWVVKLDSSGNILWQNTIGGNDEDKLTTIKTTPDGGYIVGGMSSSDISGDKTENAFRESNNCCRTVDYWVIKLDNVGNIQWQKTLGGDWNDMLFAIDNTIDGGYILGGYSESRKSSVKKENYIGGADYWIIKLDNSGNIQWENTIGGTGHDYLYSMQQTTDGGFILGGYSESPISGDKLEKAKNTDYWIVKIRGGNLVTGKCFIDYNNNGTKDIVEPIYNQIQVLSKSSSTYQSIPNSKGVFYNYVDSGSVITTTVDIPYYTSSPLNHISIFKGFNKIDTVDFALLPSPNIIDVRIVILPIAPALSGKNSYYTIKYMNVGTDTVNGQVSMVKHSKLTVVSSTPNYNSLIADTLKWIYSNLLPGESRSINVALKIPQIPNLNLGDSINSIVKIDPISIDSVPFDNVFRLKEIIVGAYDPNDKSMITGNNFTLDQVKKGEYLTYLIRFQNTGTFKAFNIVVKDTLDEDLDFSSFEMISASHNYKVKIINNKNIEWTFNDIMLPDSTSNEPASHGSICYRIKPKKNLITGNIITNTAYIYFDYNPPIVTNTSIIPIGNIIITNSNIDSNLINYNLKVYPNPFNDNIIIQSNSIRIQKIKMFDILGQEVNYEVLSNEDDKKILYTNNLICGIYFLQIISNNSVLNFKIIKN